MSDVNSKEWQLIEKLLASSITEQRRARRWGIFFKLLTFLYLFFILAIALPGRLDGEHRVTAEHTGLVDVSGIISADDQANADAIVSGLRKAFESQKAKGIVLRINSPGGSPVQSDLVYDEIQRLRTIHSEKKIYAVIGDLGASGAYYIASAADEIYANEASIVGSIGVISAGFGFVGAIEKLGVERRVFSAGDNKAMLDAFSEINEAEASHFETLLTDVHDQFITSVKAGRGERLSEEEQNVLFSGRMWTGRQALELGLVDGLGSAGYVAREVIGAEDIVNYTAKPDPLDMLFNRVGVSVRSLLDTAMQPVRLY